MTVFGDGSGGRYSDDPRKRRCGAAVATVWWCAQSGQWKQGAMKVRPLAGPLQSVPRAETLALAMALEGSSGALLFVTDHQALLRAWPRRSRKITGGPNEDLWHRIRQALQSRGEGTVELEWMPSHAELDAERFASPRGRFLAAGNAVADVGAGIGAELAWGKGIVHAAAHGDLWDATAALERRRARKAIQLALEADAERATRVERAARAPPPSKRQEAIARSSHSFRSVGPKWQCSDCLQLVHDSSLLDFCSTPCVPPPAPIAIEARAPRARAEEEEQQGVAAAIHTSHRAGWWGAFSLHFCHECGRYATVDFRHLRRQCPGSTPKGRENLSRIARGLYPRREGAPKAVSEAARLDVEAEAIQQAEDRRELQSAGVGLVSPGVASSSGEREAENRPSPGPARSVSVLESVAAPLDPEEEAADWLLGNRESP